MLKHHTTYEIMQPETVGLHASSLVLGKHSGRHAFRKRLEELGYGDLSKEELNKAFDRFKRLADKKKIVTDSDIEAIISDEFYQPEEIWKLNDLHVTCGDRVKATATVTLTDPNGAEFTDAAIGTGPVDAVYKAINRIVGVSNQLTEFVVNAVTEGIDAIGEVTIRIQPENGEAYTTNPQTGAHVARTFSGHGASTDIIVASARAYMSALNKLMAARQDQASTIQQKVVEEA
jgi:2-isopropylmalate synthase